jgi:hypothetical protein
MQLMTALPVQQHLVQPRHILMHCCIGGVDMFKGQQIDNITTLPSPAQGSTCRLGCSAVIGCGDTNYVVIVCCRPALPLMCGCSCWSAVLQTLTASI